MNDRRRNAVRIDYDRLAEAINNSSNSLTKEDIKEAIIEANQEIETEKKKHTYSGEVLSFLVSPMMGMISAVGFCFTIMTIYTVFNKWSIMVSDFKSGFIVVFLAIMFVLIGGTLTYTSFQASRELRDSNDFNLLSTVLMSLTSFIAMIVAAVALLITLKG